ANLVGTNATIAGTGKWVISGNVTLQNGGRLRGCNNGAVADGVFEIGGNLSNNGTGTIGPGPGTGDFRVSFINGTNSSPTLTPGSADSIKTLTVNSSKSLSLSSNNI